MNNSVFGKTMENLRNRVDIKLVRTDGTENEKIRKLIANPNFTVVYRTVASNGTCDSVRRVIAYLGFGFQVGHLFILFFFLLFLITASPFGC